MKLLKSKVHGCLKDGRNFLKTRVNGPTSSQQKCGFGHVQNLLIFSGASLGFIIFEGSGLILECKSKRHKPSRLVEAEETDSKPDVAFDWKQFFDLLWLDILSLSLAIIVSYW